ncbi:hypothetical protein ADL35_00530 [Streptomyces sp. NRRL WC-3753]|nr:hypothetical protein ADL35_00530 [Streptomyces sp. NRRL WC-3753]
MQHTQHAVASSGSVIQTFDLDRIFSEIPDKPLTEVGPKSLRKLEAITKVLSVYGVLEQLTPKEQDNLLGSILGIMEAENLG